jgi:hypothetical protein
MKLPEHVGTGLASANWLSGSIENPPAEFQCMLGLKTQGRDCSPQLV